MMACRLNPTFLLLLAVLLCSVKLGNAMFGNKERVRLQDVNVLTLKDGYMTTGRRSSPVKQLQCVGGSAGCSAFRPQVVQCYNRGSDGYDVQWECKSDMDNAYRFGKIEVICEGYDHPDDEYILRGSCGLEFTIDLTKEGHQKQNQQHNYYGGSGGSYGNNYSYSRKSSSITDWISLAIVAVIIYALYKTCIQTPVLTGQADTDDGYGGGQGYWGGGGGGGGGSPPPPGFRPDYQSGSCGSGSGAQYRQGGNAAPGGGGFWTGAATGGLLGYMFGNRGNRGYGGYGGYGGYARPRTGFGYSSRANYGGFGGGGFGGGGFGGGGSTGTRTASGFGGTRRR